MSDEPTKKKTGRPKKVIPKWEMEYMARLGMSTTDIATCLGVAPSTLYQRRFATVIDKWRSELKRNLRMALIKNALGGNVIAPSYLIRC